MAHVSELRVALTTSREGTYGRHPTTKTEWFKTLLRNRELTALTPTRESDEDRVGKGDEFARSEFTISWDARRRLEFDLSGQVLAWALAFATAMEGAPKTVTENLNARVYKYVLKDFSSVTRQTFAFSVLEQVTSLGTAYNRIYRGMAIDRLTLAGDGLGRPILTCEGIGSGSVYDNSDNMAPDYIDYNSSSLLDFRDPVSDAQNKTSDGVNYLFNANVTLKGFDEDGNVFNYTDPANSQNLLRSWQFSLVQNLLADRGYFPGGPVQDSSIFQSGAVRGRLEIGTRAVELEFTADMNQNSPEFQSLLKGVTGSVDIALEGQAITAEGTETGFKDIPVRVRVVFPKVSYSVVETNVGDGDIIQVRVQAKPLFATGATEILNMEQTAKGITINEAGTTEDYIFAAAVTVPKIPAGAGEVTFGAQAATSSSV